MPEGVTPIYKEVFSPASISREVEGLLGNEYIGMVGEVEEVIARMQRKPTRNVVGALSVLDMADDQCNLFDRNIRGYRTEVNIRALDKIYEKYGVIGSQLKVEPSEDELWLTLTHQTDKGFSFREIWGYYPGHIGSDFAPDLLTVLVEAIREPASDSAHYREPIVAAPEE